MRPYVPSVTMLTLAAFLLAILGMVFVYRSPLIQNHLDHVRSRIAASYKMYQEAQIMEMHSNVAMPDVSVDEIAEKVKPNQIPKLLRPFATSLKSPILKKVRFKKDDLTGWLLQAHNEMATQCPLWASVMMGEMRLLNMRKTEHLTRYEFRSSRESILAETRQSRAGCEVEIYLKDLPATAGKSVL